MTPIIKATNLSKHYGTKKNPIKALGPINFEINKGEFTLILGKSGSGKSTLLNLLAGLDKATNGDLIIENNDISKFSARKLSKYRASIGIIFQFYNLLPNLNTIENILMGAWAGGSKANKTRARELMKQFGIDHREKSNVKILSGGEKQRVAICRALISDPDILFCDEPTGALDSNNERQVIEILKQISDSGKTIIMVTHSKEFTPLSDKIIYLRDGLIVDQNEFEHKNQPTVPTTSNINYSMPLNNNAV